MKAAKKVELLAPAGNAEAFYGAIHAGADAVYLGGNRFGARAYAENFSEEELEENRIEEYSSWKTLKPVCYSLIKGKRLPESFRIVFQMPPSARDRFVAGKVPGIYPDQVGGLYINIQYENHEMICVTGTSMKQFTMDRTLENDWDENVRKFLRNNGAAVS